MISVEQHLRSATHVSLTLRVTDVDRSDLDGVAGAVRPTTGGAWLVAWEWPSAMAPDDPVGICTRHITDVLTAAALAWLGNGATIDVTGYSA